MKTATSVMAALAVGVCILVVSGTAAGLSQSATSAPVQSRKGVPLQELGQGSERELVVEKDVSPPLSVLPPAGMSELEWMTSVSDVVLLVRVTAIAPSLTPNQDWITSKVTATVLEVLKERASVELEKGGSVTFSQDGGDMVVQGRRILARLPYARGFVVGQSYLLFATPGEAAGEFIVGPESTFEVRANTQLASLKTRGSPSPEEGLRLDVARQRIQVAAARKQR